MTGQGRVALVTGASSGIGNATAMRLAQQGFRVYGTSRDRSFRAAQFAVLEMDVTDDRSVQCGVDRLLEEELRLDVLVNNAGYALAGAVEDTGIEEGRRLMDVNFWGAFRLCRAVLPQMRRQGSGLIVNISSLGGLFGLPFQALYSASKFALEGLSEALRYEEAGSGVKVSLIEPGDIRTNITASRILARGAAEGSAHRADFERALSIIQKEEIQGAGADRVAELVCSVVNTRNPRMRYTCGRVSQRLAPLLKTLAPYSVFERVLADFYGLSRRARLSVRGDLQGQVKSGGAST